MMMHEEGRKVTGNALDTWPMKMVTMGGFPPPSPDHE